MNSSTPTYSASPSTDTTTPRKATSEARSIVDRVEEVVPRIKQSFTDMVETGEERVRELRHGVKDSIRERPVQSLLTAAGIGALIGLVLGRSRQ